MLEIVQIEVKPSQYHILYDAIYVGMKSAVFEKIAIVAQKVDSFLFVLIFTPRASQFQLIDTVQIYVKQSHHKLIRV